VEITILGSGTILSGPNRNAAGFLLRRDNHTALLDCGPGVLHRLKERAVHVLELDTLFLTHFHLDHCADVFPLLMNRALLDSGANRRMTIIAPSGLRRWFEQIAATQGSWLHNDLPDLIELEGQTVYWAGCAVHHFANGHTPQSVSYRIEEEGRSVFFSGDCGFSDGLVYFAGDSALAFCECSYPDEAAQEGHLTPETVAALAQKAGFGRLVLVHIYPENDTPDLTERVKKHYKEEVLCGADFMQFDTNRL